MKLEANFLKVSPAYLTTTPGNETNGTYASTNEIGVTILSGNGTKTNFYVTRHADFTSTNVTTYKLNVSTSLGDITIPQLGGVLTMNGRDSKIHVTDYDMDGTSILYSSAEIFSWAKTAGSRRVLILYGGADEAHEAAFLYSIGTPHITEGSGVTIAKKGMIWILNWQVTPNRRVLEIGDLTLYILWRNEAYDLWVMELPAPEPLGNFTSMSKASVIVKAGYLLRTAALVGNELRLSGDVNATTDIEVISSPKKVKTLLFNGERLHTTKSKCGNLLGTVVFKMPLISSPDFSDCQWKYLDSLPEIQASYDDSLWTPCALTTTNNPWNMTTPTSLYASDYGYHGGSLIYRGHFISTGNESTFFVNTTGGYGFAHSIWLNGTFLESWVGSGSNETYGVTLTLPPSLKRGSSYVFTILIDHMGQDEEAPGTDAVKFPRGIMDYSLSGHNASDVTWKVTGNLGGEQYRDLARGPRNEGAMFAERQGYHLPDPPSENWITSSPIGDGISSAGIGFYTTNFDLNVPDGYDVPMSFVFNGTATNVSAATSKGRNYRCQLFVNGYQFGKYGQLITYIILCRIFCDMSSFPHRLLTPSEQLKVSVLKLPSPCLRASSTTMGRTTSRSPFGH